MPDQPDDAPKRHQRGVFPPFFAPRNGGRPDGSPTPPSGSWRRVSRLFTPPEGTRQRRTPAAPQTPYTPPPRPTEPVAPLDSATPAAAIDEQPAVPAAPDGSEATIQQQDATCAPESAAEALELEQAASDEMARGLGPEISGDGTFTVRDELYAPHSAAPDSLEESLDAIGEMAFGDGTDDLMVESLESQPIALEPSDAGRMDVAVDAMDEILSPSVVEDAAESFTSDVTYDAMYSTAPYEETQIAQPEASQEVLESVERYLAEEPALVDDQAAADGADGATIVSWDEEAMVGYDHEPIAEHDHLAVMPQDHEPATAGDSVEGEARDVDPWAGAELPEPAFGSIGWPSMGEAPPEPNPAVDGIDEMGAALAWGDDEGVAGTGEQHDPPGAGGPSGSYDDALSSVVGELRDSSSAWKSESDSIVDERADVAARAHFYAAPEPIDPLDEIAAAAEEDAYTLGLAAAPPGVEASGDVITERAAGPAAEATADASNDDHAGAAIADALARVAARIRAGEVDLPAEAAGASDESALAAALAALLRGSRR